MKYLKYLIENLFYNLHKINDIKVINKNINIIIKYKIIIQKYLNDKNIFNISF